MPRSTSTESHYSVCIGINHYYPSAGLSSLRFAEVDAQAIDTLLGELGFEEENRRLLLGEAATLDAVNETLSTIILDKAEMNDLVIFYFAGHSLPLIINQREVDNGAAPRSEVFLATYDFDRQKIKGSLSFRTQRALGMERLRREFFENGYSRKRLFMFDSCYSGDFFGASYRDDEILDPVQSYIKQMLNSESTGRVALSSCLPIQKAVEDPALGHGRFTHYVLKAFSGEALEALGRDGCLTVNSLFEYLAKQLPLDQRPVLSGVQQDTFTLVCYRDKAGSVYPPIPESKEAKHAGKEAQLRIMFADHSSFLRNRLESFIGRETELAQIKHQIGEKLKTGGYVTITGQAGQGKSSIIAKLVEEYGLDNVAFHFIPFNPGPDHQVGLLRNLMARLILKYDLSDLYVASENRAALRDLFPKVLGDLVAKDGREVILIDGLDQLEEEPNGVRDLSFLPNNPPSGVVFVLGTRPNDTLKPLELLKPRHEYKLPNLSRSDFDLILSRRKVKMSKELTDRFYEATQENALYLDLVAKELSEKGATSPDEVIKRVTDNPDNIFSLAIDRLKRQEKQWRAVLKPMLGLLLVTSEPLEVRHIRRILMVEDDEVRDGLRRLGGLIAEDGQGRRYLFHLKLQEYLRQDENNPNKEYIFANDEEIHWHKKLASWCEQNGLESIWADTKADADEQGRRVYARQHYISHLYRAKDWERVWSVLDEGSYGRAKVKYDLSMRSYAKDLDLGRQAAAWEGWEIEEGLIYLPHLWRYTLLRCNLGSRADNYSPEAFEALMLLKRYQEAVGLAELLTKSDYKVRILLQIAGYFAEQTDLKQESNQLLIRAHEVAQSIENSMQRVKALGDIGRKLIKARQWEFAEKVAHTIEISWERAKTLRELGIALVEAQQWEHAEAVIGSIEVSWERDNALRELSTGLAKAQQWEHAEAVIGLIEISWEKARALQELGIALVEAHQQDYAETIWVNTEKIVSIINQNDVKLMVLQEFISTLVKVQRWDRVEAVVRMIEDVRERAKAFGKLSAGLAKAQQWEHAEVVISSIEVSWERDNALRELSTELFKAKQWKRVEKVVKMIEGNRERAGALQKLGAALAQAQQWKRAENVWAEAEVVMRMIENKRTKVAALSELGVALAQAQQWEHAENVWAEALAIARTIPERDTRGRAEVLLELGTTLARAQQWEHAGTLIQAIEDKRTKIAALSALGAALAQAQQWKRAENVWAEAEVVMRMIEDKRTKVAALSELGDALARAQQWEHAENVWAEALAIARKIAVTEEIPPPNITGRRDKALLELVTMMAKEQQWERAEALMQAIKDKGTKAEALRELGTALIREQHLKRAKAVWKEALAVAASDYSRSEVLLALSTALAESHLQRHAEMILAQASAQVHRIITNSEISSSDELEILDKIGILLKLGTVYARTHQLKRAEAIWMEALAIARKGSANDYGQTKIKALQMVVTELARAQQWERAEAIVHEIKEDRARNAALRELGISLARAQQWERAEAVMHAVWKKEDKAAILLELARSMEMIGDPEKILRLSQRSLSQANDREYVIGLLPLVSTLIPLKPELGTAFFEAFNWLDTFLKKSGIA